MKRITLDFTGIDNRDDLHRYLKERLEFPEYYGKNLDALYDELTSIAEDTEIVFAEEDGPVRDSSAVCREADRNRPETSETRGEADRPEISVACKEAAGPEIARSETMERYLRKTRRVFEDAAEKNRHLHV